MSLAAAVIIVVIVVTSLVCTHCNAVWCTSRCSCLFSLALSVKELFVRGEKSLRKTRTLNTDMLQAQLHALITRSGTLLRAQRGLYAGKQRLSGNSISFSHRKYVPPTAC